ncbi:MAG: tRNA 2-thiouridine(34) synthase MnmA [Oscillospiraceae bacterium]|nr:tRNA 2-thiouridine(34) synthase MnmA [Oscillospiraceae bacterium]
MEKIVLGLSGGVDSAVAAKLLSSEFEVHCVYLDIGLGGDGGRDAAAVAACFGLGFETIDIRDELEAQVCTPFAAAYLAGQTPLPCARCNPAVKFPALLGVADRIGARYVATGHYARIEDGRLKKGTSANDQSYMLARLPREMLTRIRFPLGGYEKTAVRALAAQIGLPVADKPDSMEICFIPDGDYAVWLEKRGKTPPPGEFVDGAGNVLGHHRGIHAYTLGQRRGLGVSGPHRYFVSAIHPERNEVVLSDGGDLLTTRVWCGDRNWLDTMALTAPRRVSIRLRHTKTVTPAVISLDGDGVLIETEMPVRAPTPGQLAVFYDGDVVLGSGWIAPDQTMGKAQR